MKKIMGSFIVVTALFVLSACGKSITTDDLKAHDWITESKNSDPDMIISFTDHVVTFKADTSSMQSTATNEWEKMGEEFGKSIVEKMNFKYEYTLEKNKMTWIDDDKDDNDAVYTVEKDGDNLILTPVDDKDSKDSKELVLKPYKKKVKESSSKQTSSESTSAVSSSETSSTVNNYYSGNNNEPTADYSVPSTNANNNVEDNNYDASSQSRAAAEQAQAVQQVEQSAAQQAQEQAAAASASQVQAAATTPSSVSETTTIVQSGEGFQQVAARVGVSVEKLAQLNGRTILPDGSFSPAINPGDSIRIN
ncbi:MAG: LysM peptidoglycan-binding domain-containing protein [Vagococcus sp.]